MPSPLFRIFRLPQKTPSRVPFYSAFSFRSLSLGDAPSGRFSSLLREFSEDVVGVKSVHARIVVNGIYGEQRSAAELVRAYRDLGCLGYARGVFDQIPHPEASVCAALLVGYLRCELYGEALAFFELMRSRDLEIDGRACNFALKACSMVSDYERGMDIITIAVNKGIQRNQFLASSMVNFLMKFGKVKEARMVFDGLPERDVVCWNSMIGGYVQARQFNDAFILFFEMCKYGVRPSPVTMTSIIQACERVGNLDLGKSVHGFVLCLEMGNDVLVLTSLVNMYAKLGDVVNARLVFDSMTMRNLVSWNAMISGYVQNGFVHEAFELFFQLLKNHCRFDSGTVVSLLHGCALTANFESGKMLHGFVYRAGLELDVILCTALVDLYSKCDALNLALSVFNRTPNKNVITWTAMLVGLAQNGLAEEALRLFSDMQQEGVAANSITLVSLVHCCAHLGSLKKGKSIHAHLLRNGYALSVVNMTALIDMYAKCGKVEYADRVIHYSPVREKDVVLWNSLIGSYGMHGFGERALAAFNQMKEEGVSPNESTFISLLTACNHSGLVEEGVALFRSMQKDHNIRQSEKLYACFVDLLSRAGRLGEAEALVEEMPFKSSSASLEALLNGCRTHKNVNLGVKTADKLLCLGAANPGVYVVLSNIYAVARQWDKVDQVRRIMRQCGLKKTPGYSLIEIGNQLHTFLAGDSSHPKHMEIDETVDNLKTEVEASGYVPDTSCIIRDVDESMKVKLLWGHSERLAIAFGLLSTPAGSLIRIIKNLRVCNDCHNVTKYISKIVQREIVVRDANRFHHFKNGKCSCNDYW
ncbi:pentatricopeptide repeat-containing protein At3g12770-like [Syzygium oleosum]|uniref:pentatricopeptide repeat-containing protein At3g12770-like n=1 Tax=Syzygium oleosum TaxID=219896 RepID=UPI0011D1A5F9|nr:pentatricopeptide repeat-containing protein At3g12770-like [Syzygium oleosum]